MRLASPSPVRIWSVSHSWSGDVYGSNLSFKNLVAEGLAERAITWA